MDPGLRLREAFRSPRGLIALFVLLTVAPAIGLVYMGGTVVAQQRAIASQHRVLERARVEKATELVVTALDQQLKALLQQMAEPSRWPTLSREDRRLWVLGIPPNLPEAPSQLFEPGEADEYKEGFKPALESFTALTGNADPSVRAGALLRLGRVLRKAGRTIDARDVYRQLAQYSDVAVAGGRPADLVALYMLCVIANQLKEDEVLRRDADALRTSLRRGRWLLDEATFSMYDGDAAKWLDQTPDERDDGLRSVIKEVWEAWESAQHPGSGFDGHRLIGPRELVLWRADSPRLVLLAVDSPRVQEEWLAAVKPLLSSQRVLLSFVDPPTRLTGRKTDEASESLLLPERTHLPWAIRLTSADTALAPPVVTGQAVVLGASALFLVVVIAGCYSVARAVHRELSVARLQSDFVSAVSHEFRTPLTSLRQITEILVEDRVADQGRRVDYYRKQLRATDRLRRLVETLLDFGRMEAGSRPYQLRPVNVSLWIRDVVGEFQREVAAKDHTIEIEADASCIVDADEEALAHAVRNLLDNAVKYSPERNTVWVQVDRLSGRCAIRVRDEGLGIPEDEQDAIWKKFVRGSAAKLHAIKGTGVGLAMVRHIVEAHHGRVDVQSHPGRGSTFTLLLPESPIR